MTFAASVPVAEKNAVCATCHTRGAVSLWNGSTHETRNVACVTCHSPHGGNPKLLVQKTQQQLCTQCHQQIRLALRKPSHHPLREDKMQCTSCHNPHGTQTPKLIAANSVNDKCTECHAEKRGPFLFEHPPVRESCLNCHDPHGSSHEPLLVAKKPLLCQRCHSNFLHPGGLYANPRSPVGTRQTVAPRSAGDRLPGLHQLPREYSRQQQSFRKVLAQMSRQTIRRNGDCCRARAPSPLLSTGRARLALRRTPRSRTRCFRSGACRPYMPSIHAWRRMPGSGCDRCSQPSRPSLQTFSGPAVHRRPGRSARRWRCSASTMSAHPRNSRSFAICGTA